MVNSNTTRRAPKASKPRPDFPLFPHASGRWAKKVQGTLLYFGPTANDPRGDKAIAVWLAEKDYCLLHGRRPPKTTGRLTVGNLANKLLNDKHLAVTHGDLTLRTFNAWHQACAAVIRQFGANRHVETVGPDDFRDLLQSETAGKAATTRHHFVRFVRGLFRYAHNENQRLIDSPVLFGESFKAPRRPKTTISHGGKQKMFTAEQIREILALVKWPMQAFVLLAINCGFGNSDCATLTFDTLDLENGWHNHPRPKTNTSRRCPLWPETVAAIERSLKIRPKPLDPADKDLVFLTRNGRPYVRLSSASAEAMKDDPALQTIKAGSIMWDDAIHVSFHKTLRTLGMKRLGLSFYALRHTFETIAGASRDQVAVDHVMGHITPGMGTNYRHRIEDDRLQVVADHVHGWLFGVEVQGGTK
jgi:integrase